ncbi:hypothetical protein L291_1141 [Acinetobacter guillouiae MSP4-18]|nr:hypothetical protein L291_1141 [Acinetobacter guillouiae MSP4-18]
MFFSITLRVKISKQAITFSLSRENDSTEACLSQHISVIHTAQTAA